MESCIMIYDFTIFAKGMDCGPCYDEEYPAML